MATGSVKEDCSADEPPTRPTCKFEELDAHRVPSEPSPTAPSHSAPVPAYHSIPRLRSGHSPFFGGSRPSSQSLASRQKTASSTSLRSFSPGRLDSSSCPPTATASPSSLVQRDFSDDSGRSTPSTASTDLVENLSAASRPCAPKRVLRPDNWWHQERPSSVRSPATSLPPPIPAKSPLRLLYSSFNLTPTLIYTHSPSRRFEHPASDPDQALCNELTPSPLCIKKIRHPTRPQEETAFEKSQQTKASVRRASDFGSSKPEAPRLTQELIRNHSCPEEFSHQSAVSESVDERAGEVGIHRRGALGLLQPPFRGSGHHPPPHRTGPFCKLTSKPTCTMDSLHPDSAAAMTAHRREAVRLAEAQQRAVAEKCKRSRQAEPDYIFDELIGKGSFGRVYKGRQRSTKKVVAIKVLDIDDTDFQAYGDQKDEQIRDFNREIRILRQAQESGAQNLNQMIEALPVHSQLWLVCEYCPGGSVKTLMRATGDRLSERYIIVVARELAKALRGLHEAGIMHRDVKAANVLIHQDGGLQLCDFGVATVLDTSSDKRKTFIGTLHWMPPELWTENPEYSDEVDVWEYGCTLYECAIGRPPNSDLRERQQLKMRMRRLKQAITLPDAENCSDGLRSLVAYTLSPDVASRPSMKDVLQHDFLRDTETTHPTSILTELVQTYYGWLFSGGQRTSLFMPGGAAAASTGNLEAALDPDDEWNFSMTQDFERRVSAILEIPDFSVVSPEEPPEGEATPRGAVRPSARSPEMTDVQKANFEIRVKRGADLTNLFDQDAPAYEYKTKTDFVPIPEQRRISDLPFRAMAEDRPSSIASNVIDLGDFDESDYAAAATPRTDDKIQTTYAATPLKEETIRLADASTLREKRANSKGPRESAQPSLTACRSSAVADDGVNDDDVASQDFALLQAESTVKGKSKAPELQEPAEITSSRHPGHATMDWSFANAMSEAAVPEIVTPDDHEEQTTAGTGETADSAQKNNKHATMDWSFSSAMAEASVNATKEPSTAVGPSPPQRRNRPTPTRPPPLMRQMTMPVTIDDFAQAEGQQEIPRPSTALSEAYSDISATSTDVDPFGLERDDDDHPGPATLDGDMPSGMGGFYSGRGRTMIGEQPGIGINGPGYGSSPFTANGTHMSGSKGAASTPRHTPASGSRTSHARNSSVNVAPMAPNAWNSTPTGAAALGHSEAKTLVVNVPPAHPPRPEALDTHASPVVVEAELVRLLEEMHGALNVAREVVGGLDERERKGDEESEWTDEE